MSVEEIQALRSLAYEQYLRTDHWRARRNRALKLATYRCQRCTDNRNLQVHHLSYDRLGEELDDDLQVLCRGCHLGHHVAEATPHRSVYLAIVSAALKVEKFACLADLVEEVKVRCAKLKLPYADGQVQAAIARLDDKRLALEWDRHPELLDEGRGDAPMTRAEAAGWMARLGGIAKPMPSVPKFTRKQADSLRVIKQIAALTIDQIARCEEAERVAAEAAAAPPTETR